jgi:Arc-like DNA binding domain
MAEGSQFRVRLGEELHQRLDAAARDNRVSMNREVVRRLEDSFAGAARGGPNYAQVVEGLRAALRDIFNIQKKLVDCARSLPPGSNNSLEALLDMMEDTTPSVEKIDDAIGKLTPYVTEGQYLELLLSGQLEHHEEEQEK